MKNNKGFTLVEVLAVVAILVTIIVIVTPKIFKQFKTAEEVTDKEQINTLINTAKLYMNQNSNLLPQENDIYVIQMQELKDSGLIKTNQILNPSTKEELNGCIIVKYENNKYKYEYKEELEQITVTFDPQGGTLQETSKNVIPGEKYGTLPTPTRDGYTFMGWNGKNMFDEETILMAIPGAIHENECYVFNPQKAHSLYGTNGTNKILLNFKENTQYTMSIEASTDSNEILFLGFVYNGETTSSLNERITLKSNEIIKSYATSNANKTVNQITISYGYGTANVHVKYIQLEEGDTATPYEPYYITPSTTVVQENNHTLKAIWKANS